MREDMARLLVLRGRSRSRLRYKVRRGKAHWRRNPEDAPERESMGRGWRDKEPLEYFAPLRRYLGRNVGRLWDLVFSDICERLRPDSTVQKHVLDHLLHDFVERSVFLDQGKPFCFPYGNPVHSGGFYVCPKTRRLLRAPHRPRLRERPGSRLR